MHENAAYHLWLDSERKCFRLMYGDDLVAGRNRTQTTQKFVKIALYEFEVIVIRGIENHLLVIEESNEELRSNNRDLMANFC